MGGIVKNIFNFDSFSNSFTSDLVISVLFNITFLPFNLCSIPLSLPINLPSFIIEGSTKYKTSVHNAPSLSLRSTKIISQA